MAGRDRAEGVSGNRARSGLRARTGGRGALATRTIGEILITVGIIAVLYVFYALYVTGWMTAAAQREAEQDLEQRWAEQRETGQQELTAGVVPGEAFARIHIPALGTDYSYTVAAGVAAEQLEAGPGHYPHTSLPGEPGNVGIAGHRVGGAAPFGELDELASCAAVILETGSDFFVYRVLPFADELERWSQEQQQRPDCAAVPSLRGEDLRGDEPAGAEPGDAEPGNAEPEGLPEQDAEGSGQPEGSGQADPGGPAEGDTAPGGTPPGGTPYGDTLGQRVLERDELATSAQTDPLAPVPYRPAELLDRLEQAALLTLMTAHPPYSDSQRLVVHGVLTQQIPKSQVGDDPQTVLDQIERG